MKDKWIWIFDTDGLALEGMVVVIADSQEEAEALAKEECKGYSSYVLLMTRKKITGQFVAYSWNGEY